MSKSRADLELRASDKASSVLGRFNKRISNLNTALRRSERRFQLFSKRVDRSLGSIKRLGEGMQKVGRKMTTHLSLPIAAAGGLAINEFRKFEKGLIGVGKTTNIQGPRLAALGEEFIKLSKVMPLSAQELLALGEAAGQMGISGEDNILAFTKAMAKLQFTTDVEGEEGARAIARILKVTKEGPKNIIPFADTLVFLGNTLEATESEILGVANRIAGNTSRFKISSNEILALAGAFKSLGKESELVGSVTGKMFNSIQQAILDGGKNQVGLKTLQTLTGGMSKKQLKEAFDTAPVKLFLKTLTGLKKVSDSKTGNFIKVIQNLGLEGVRVNDIIGTATEALDVFNLKLGQIEAGQQLNALDTEFGQFLKSLDADMNMTLNSIKSLGITIGRDLSEPFREFLRLVRSAANFLNANTGFRNFLIVMGGIAAVLGPLVFGLGTLAFAFVQMKIALPLLIPLLESLALAVGSTSLAGLGVTVLAVGGAFAAWAVAINEVVKAWPDLKNATVSSVFDWLKSELDTIENTLNRVIEKLSFGTVKIGSSSTKDGKTERPKLGEIDKNLGFYDMPRSLPRRNNASSVNVNQKAELRIKVDGTSGSNVKVKDQSGFDKIQIVRGMQGRF